MARIIYEEAPRREVDVVLRDWLFQAEKLAFEELAKLVEDEGRSPMAYNHYYTDNVQNARQETMKLSVKKAVEMFTDEDCEGKLHISNNTNGIGRFIAALQTKINVNMNEQACKEALTELNTYYKVRNMVP